MDQEKYVLFEFVADKGQAPFRIDKFITERIENISRAKVRAAIDEQRVMVNKKIVKSNYKVRPEDQIEIIVFEEPKVFELLPEDIPIDIFYEDEDLIIINKKPGIAVHPGVGNYTGTLSNALAFHFTEFLDQENKHPYLAHRIDKDTSGLLVVAKNETTLRALAKQFKNHSIKRKYWALVWGAFEESEGTISGNITRSKRDRTVFTVTEDPEVGKHAITHYKVLEDFNYASLVECQLETGRTHQIRVHMRYKGHPIFSDTKYGGDRILKGVVFSKYRQFIDNCFKKLPRQALHAKSLGFIHPRTKEEVYFESELPEDFQTVLDKWRSVNATYSFSQNDSVDE